MSAAEYHALKQYLTAPPVRVIDDWPEFVHPHTPPDDAEWPLPSRRTMRR